MTAALATLLLETLACIGYGAAILRWARLLPDLAGRERLPWAFTLGYGALGWLVFPVGVAGWLDAPALAGLCLPGLALLAAERRALLADRPADPPPGPLGWALLTLLATVFAMDLAEGLSPPADADSLAYHFALAKEFLHEGTIIFVPRAVDGAVPLLVQMTYVVALGLGGELALTLWQTIATWMLAWLFFAIARRWLPRDWALAATLVLMTVPAMVYGAGSGQVEAKLAMFVLVAAVAIARSLRNRSWRWALIAGIAVGFYVGTKYLGLLFALAGGLVLLAGRGWLVRGAVFSAGVVGVGFQWYLWNWLHTGDPVFPMLFGLLGSENYRYWDAAHAAFMKESFFATEIVVPRDFLWFLTYPFVATLAGPPEFESGRTGFGPYVLLVLPFALAGLWRRRHDLGSSALLPLAAIVLASYALWFFSGASQRVRHLLPLLPLLILLCTIAARSAGSHNQKVFAAVFLAVLPQIAGQVLFARSFVSHLVTGESRSQFFARTVSGYAPVPWINANLSARDRLAVLNERQLLYLIERRAFWAHLGDQIVLDFLSGARDAVHLFDQLRSQGFTYLLYYPTPETQQEGPFDRPLDILFRKGCIVPKTDIDAIRFGSRTVGPGQGERVKARIIEILPEPCLREKTEESADRYPSVEGDEKP